MVLILHWSSDSAFNHCSADQDLHILSVLLSGLGDNPHVSEIYIGQRFHSQDYSYDPSGCHLSCPPWPPPPHWLSKTCPSTDAHPSSMTACPTLSQWCFNGQSGLSLSSVVIKPQASNVTTSWHTRMQLCLIWSPKPCGCPPPRLVLSDGKVGNWKWLPQVGKIWPTGSKNTSGRLWEHLSWCVQPIFKERHDECMGETALVL